MARFAPFLGLALLASGASAAEGDVRAFTFDCHVTTIAGEQRQVTGSIKDVEAKHARSGAYWERSVQISDGEEQLSKEMLVEPHQRGFEVIFADEPVEDAPIFSAMMHYRSFDFDWNGLAQSESVVVLGRWYEPRPAVRAGRIRDAAGICKFTKEGAEA